MVVTVPSLAVTIRPSAGSTSPKMPPFVTLIPSTPKTRLLSSVSVGGALLTLSVKVIAVVSLSLSVAVMVMRWLPCALVRPLQLQVPPPPLPACITEP